MPPNAVLKRVGARIQSLRRREGLSQEALADRAGIDRSYMSGIERGVCNPSVLMVVKIAKALDVQSSALLGDD